MPVYCIASWRSFAILTFGLGVGCLPLWAGLVAFTCFCDLLLLLAASSLARTSVVARVDTVLRHSVGFASNCLFAPWCPDCAPLWELLFLPVASTAFFRVRPSSLQRFLSCLTRPGLFRLLAGGRRERSASAAASPRLVLPRLLVSRVFRSEPWPLFLAFSPASLAEIVRTSIVFSHFGTFLWLFALTFVARSVWFWLSIYIYLSAFLSLICVSAGSWTILPLTTSWLVYRVSSHDCIRALLPRVAPHLVLALPFLRGPGHGLPLPPLLWRFSATAPHSYICSSSPPQIFLPPPAPHALLPPLHRLTRLSESTRPLLFAAAAIVTRRPMCYIFRQFIQPTPLAIVDSHLWHEVCLPSRPLLRALSYAFARAGRSLLGGFSLIPTVGIVRPSLSPFHP